MCDDEDESIDRLDESLVSFGSMEIYGDLWRSVESYLWIWVNYNDLTATSLEPWLIRGIIPKWP